MQAIEATDLRKTYPPGVTALDGLSLTVPSGAIVGLLGPNGAGKSTTVRVLSTLTRPDTGSARVAGIDVLAEPVRVRRAIGVVGQKHGADPEATGRENLVLQGEFQGITGRELKALVARSLERFGLADAADRQVRTYSGGMQRRLDVAMGLLHRPQVLFLDEPTTGLDPEARLAMWREIERLATEELMTILLTTHHLEEADRLASRLAIVDRGRVVVEGTPDRLKRELGGDTIQVELADARGRRRAGRARPRRRRRRRHARRARAARPRARRRRRDPGRPGGARGARRAGHVGHGRPPVARRRLPAPCRPRVRASRRRARGGGGMSAVRQSWQVSLRGIRVLRRQPAYLGITLTQPLIWLLLFGALFEAVTRIPGFGDGSYIDFLTPGIVVMLAVSSAGWTGMGLIEDINSGVMDRMLASPAWRGALNAGSVASAVLTIVIQTVLIVLLALALGADYAGGVGGVLLLIAVAALLGAAFASLSNGVAVLARQRETLIGAVSLVLLPLTFLSTALMEQDLVPGWIRSVAVVNPVNWAVEAGRSAAMQQTDWGLVASRIGLLAALALACAAFATRAFARYQRSL